MPAVGTRQGRRSEHPLLGVPRRDTVTVAILLAITTALYVGVAVEPARSWIQSVDDAFLRTMASVRSPLLTTLAESLDVLGSVWVTLPLRVGLTVYLFVRRQRWHLIAFVGAIVVTEATIGLLKNIYDRSRPPGSLVDTSGASFPSGHAIAASVTAVALVIALFEEGPRRYWWGFFAAMFSLLMALSRAYLAAHWLSDAVAGVLLGVTVALGVAVVVHHAQTDATRDEDFPDMVGPP